MKKILLVDDMAIFREPIAAVLRHSGYDVKTACDGREGLALARQCRPDLILLDMAMPTMDGLRCLQALRQDPATARTPVIMLTAMSDRDLVMKAAKAGVQGFLLKSHFSNEQLLSRMKEQLEATADGAGCKSSPAGKGPQGEGTRLEPATTATSGIVATHEPGVGASGPDRDAGPDRAEAAAAGVAPPAPPAIAEAVLLAVREKADLRAAPPILQHVLALTASDRTSLEDIAAAVRNDPALSLKIMRVANSSLCGCGAEAQRIVDAVRRIGVTGVRNAAFSMLALDHFTAPVVGEFVPQRFWEHSMATAVLAFLLGRTANSKELDDLFLAGLLHDIGRLVMVASFREPYAEVLRRGGSRNLDLSVVEKEVFGIEHAEVTREALVQLKLDSSVVEAAAMHGETAARIQATCSKPQNAWIVALADRLAHAYALGDSGNLRLEPVRDYVQALKLDGDVLRMVGEAAVEKTREVCLFYTTKSGEELRPDLAREYAQAVKPGVKVRLLGRRSPFDMVAVFLDRLGLVDAMSPSIAVMRAEREADVDRGLQELGAIESERREKLGLVVLKGSEQVNVPADLAKERPVTVLAYPCRAAALVGALADISRRPGGERNPSPAAEPAAAGAGSPGRVASASGRLV